jgi:KDO2-lipid IV(A) lauroyltransferase
MAIKRKSKKLRAVQFLEFGGVRLVLGLAKFTPLRGGYWVSRMLGGLLYWGMPRRRRIALENLRHVYAATKSEREIFAIARASCASFFASLFETAKLFSMKGDAGERNLLRVGQEEFEALFRKAREIHESSGGCIFVTPHIGNWEFLPYVAFHVGIPMVIVARPLDNPYLDKFLFAYRSKSGQSIMPKTNAMPLLQLALRRGKSVGMLPDQSTMKAITVDYLGRAATATPVPAILAIRYHRPIVVVACCRSNEGPGFDGIVSDPLWPAKNGSEPVEIRRLTEAMNRDMETIIRKYPEQYFWMHDRWKIYRSKGGLSL